MSIDRYMGSSLVVTESETASSTTISISPNNAKGSKGVKSAGSERLGGKGQGC
jgi:hypothetical protein